MPTIILKKSVMEKLMGKKLPLEQLKDRISMIGTDLERIEGDEIVVEVFPNRPDMLSEPGFARALSAFIGVKPGLRNYAVKKASPSENYKVIIEKSVNDVRPFTACAVVKNIKFDDDKIRQLIQLQEKLHVTFGRNRKKLAIGVYPLEKIQLPITFKALSPDKIKFRTLESDRELTGREILETTPTGKEFAHLLEGKKMYPIFVDAKGSILSMPPVINSHETGRVTEKTRDIFVECSGFDYEVLSKCMSIMCASLADMGGDIYEMTLDYQGKKKTSPVLSPTEWKVDLAYMNKMTGLELKEKEVANLFAKMGIGYKNKKALVPSYRADILHQIDLAEELAISYGYENFDAIIPNVMTIGEEDKLEVFKNRLASALAGLGLLEISTYHLSNKIINNDLMQVNVDVVEVENSKTSDRSILRSWMLPSLMQVLSENTSKEYPQEIFEIGTVFRRGGKSQTGVAELPKLSIVLAEASADFTSAKQVLDALMASLSKSYSLEKSSTTFLTPGRQGKIVCDKVKVGFIGEVHPQVLENFKIQMPCSCLEIDIGKVYELVMKK
jgi:phenylalanyl-tRNA synthetase beta chain